MKCFPSAKISKKKLKKKKKKTEREREIKKEAGKIQITLPMQNSSKPTKYYCHPIILANRYYLKHLSEIRYLAQNNL